MKHLQVILEEMFRRVGDTYSDDKATDDGWYLQHEWTEKDQDDFIDWITNYLYTNRDARHEIMNIPIRNKDRCRKTAQWFNLMYGWKTKKVDS